MRKESVVAAGFLVILLLLLPATVLAGEAGEGGVTGETPEESKEGYLERFMGEFDCTRREPMDLTLPWWRSGFLTHCFTR